MCYLGVIMYPTLVCISQLPWCVYHTCISVANTLRDGVKSHISIGVGAARDKYGTPFLVCKTHFGFYSVHA